MAKAKLMQETAFVYKQLNANEAPFRILNKGDELELGRINRADGKLLIAVKLLDGMNGFVPEETRFFVMDNVATDQAETSLFELPTRISPKISLTEGENLFLLDLKEVDGEQWIHVKRENGEVGYVDAKTKFTKEVSTSESVMRNMMVGGLVFLVGIVITLVTISNPLVSGGYYIIAYGAIILGGIVFFKSLQKSRQLAKK